MQRCLPIRRIFVLRREIPAYRIPDRLVIVVLVAQLDYFAGLGGDRATFSLVIVVRHDCATIRADPARPLTLFDQPFLIKLVDETLSIVPDGLVLVKLRLLVPGFFFARNTILINISFKVESIAVLRGAV